MATRSANIVTTGGGHATMDMAKELRKLTGVPTMIVEANSHINLLFSVPRFADLSRHGEDFRALRLSSQNPPGSSERKGSASIRSNIIIPFEHHHPRSPAGYVLLDRAVALDEWSIPGTEKIKVLQESVEKVKNVTKVVLFGGGAVGVQVAFDIKQLYPCKSVTVIHSWPYLMNKYSPP
ncbi:hypothetical protein BJ742DRAFT_780444 [Cladochytrium replicatum]|nr:hypothetical protein BJ742DRAFT_780444 [Cladochytrium replicatum]